MSERGVGKPWSAHEDSLLTQAVAIHGENDNWVLVALAVPGRTNKACRKRWLHSLSPNVKKSAWTADEDRLLLSLYAVHRDKWSIIARQIPGRTDDACSKRYREALDPSLRKDDWTPGEDAHLLEAHSRLGGKWGNVGKELNRSGLGCRNRWRMLQRRKASLQRDGGNGQSQALADPNASQPSSEYASPSVAWSSLAVVDPRQFWDAQVTPYVSSPAILRNSTEDSPSRDGSYSLVQYSSPESPQNQQTLAHITPHMALSPTQIQYAEVSSNVSGTQYRPSNSPHSGSHRDSPVHDVSMGNIFLSSPNSSHIVSQINRTGEDYHPIDTCARYSDERGISGRSPRNITRAEPCDDREVKDVEPHIIAITSPTFPHLPDQSLLVGADTAQQDGHTTPANGERSRYYRSPEDKLASYIRRKRNDDSGPPKLSSTLQVTSDSTLLAYACGHEDCWPADAPISTHCFARSKELSDHSKYAHLDSLGGSQPFRCALDGCRKGWKSINGLQYHLQISKAHFVDAISTIQTSPEHHLSDEPDATTASKKQKKTYSCPKPNCRNQYKQLSGLRYHLLHGHPPELPVQLDVVPPTLARKVAEKMRSQDISCDARVQRPMEVV